MTVNTLNDLFIHELSDIHSAEKQLTKALPKLSRAAGHADLASMFEGYVAETQGQVGRIERVVKFCGIKLKRVKCAAMEGLVEEAREMVDVVDEGPVRDAALVAAAQKIGHYQIASYGTLAAFARHLGFDEAVELLTESLEEEKTADRQLTGFAEQKLNAKVKTDEEDEEESEDEDEEESA